MGFSKNVAAKLIAAGANTPEMMGLMGAVGLKEPRVNDSNIDAAIHSARQIKMAVSAAGLPEQAAFDYVRFGATTAQVRHDLTHGKPMLKRFQARARENLAAFHAARDKAAAAKSAKASA